MTWSLVSILVLVCIALAYYTCQRHLKILYYDLVQSFYKCSVLFKDQFERLNFIGGVDISFSKTNEKHACISLVVLDINSLKTVYAYSEFITMQEDYIPGYLAFRETPHIQKVLRTLINQSCPFYPDILIVDGNGRLHKKEFGLACHTGVLCDIPCIGVAKNLYLVDDSVLAQNQNVCNLRNVGDSIDFVNSDGHKLGCAFKSSKDSTKPIYVSEGHRVCLETAKEVIYKCCKYRVPEPIRLADILSRKILRENVPI